MEGTTVIGVSVTFQYGEDFDRARVVAVAENARSTLEGMPDCGRRSLPLPSMTCITAR
jgi:hypothetical protein